MKKGRACGALLFDGPHSFVVAFKISNVLVAV
jgi:hypothetical protein